MGPWDSNRGGEGGERTQLGLIIPHHLTSGTGNPQPPLSYPESPNMVELYMQSASAKHGQDTKPDTKPDQATL